MLKRFELGNYKTFDKKIVIDFSKVGGYQFNIDCINNGLISKMLIYGRNATGKTNLGYALIDIGRIITGLRFKPNDIELLGNADSEVDFATFKYTFQFGYDEIIYTYSRKSTVEITKEELILNGNRIFYFDFETLEQDFSNLSLIHADTVVINRFLDMTNSATDDGDMYESRGSLPFLRWLVNNTAFESNSIMMKMTDFIQRMAMVSVSSDVIFFKGIYVNFFKYLSEDDNLNDFQDFLNTMGVKCKLKLLQLPDGNYELYFDHKKPIPFISTASSGTITLLNIYRRLSLKKNISLLFIDEFDAFYHYELSEKVVSFFKTKYPNCQVILTSHNTNLMTNKLMRPDCLFILSRSGQLTALCDATNRELRQGHNLEKMYISGEFEEYE